MNIEKIDDKLYKLIYIEKNPEKYIEYWKIIRINNYILSEAIKLCKDKFEEYDTVKATTICERILLDCKNIDESIYQELINLIYSNKDIARTVVDGYANGGFSYLLLSLYNPNLKLSEEQKRFAVEEAMNKIGTVKYKQIEEEYSNFIKANNITDDDVDYITIDGMVNPIGRRTKLEFFHSMLGSLSKTQAHGLGNFDIRYHILKNSNWTKEEKKKLVYDFYADDEDYLDTIEAFEWNIINDNDNRKGIGCILERDYLYDYKYEDLTKLFKNIKTINRLWNEIEFCRFLKEVRPPKYEEEISKQKIKK